MLTDPVSIALIATVGAGIFQVILLLSGKLLAVLDKNSKGDSAVRLQKLDDIATYREQLRDDIEGLLEKTDRLQKEINRWQRDYYSLHAKYAQQQADHMVLVGHHEDLSRQFLALKKQVNGHGKD